MSTKREILMAQFLATVTDKELEECKDIYSWLTAKSEEATREMMAGNGSSAVGLKMMQHGPMSSIAATMFASEYRSTTAKNYLELYYRVPDLGDITVTIQRVAGKTPAERLEKATEQIDALSNYAHSSVKHWETRLDELGSLSETGEDLLTTGRSLLKTIQSDPV